MAAGYNIENKTEGGKKNSKIKIKHQKNPFFLGQPCWKVLGQLISWNILSSGRETLFYYRSHCFSVSRPCNFTENKPVAPNPDLNFAPSKV